MNTKEKLSKILREHNALKKSANMEESKMAKKFKENDADVDSQAPASAPVAPADGTAMKTDAPQNDAEIQKENEATVDSQQKPSDSAPASDGTPMSPDASQNKKDIQKEGTEEGDEEPSEEEPSDEPQPPIEENEDSDEDDKLEEEVGDEEEDKALDEKFKEMEDDMGKVVDVIEALKNQVDELGKKVTDMEEKFRNQAGEGEDEEEPMEPVSESAILSGALMESTKAPARKESLGDAAKAIFR